MMYLISYNPLPFMLAAVIGLATAWWIWGRLPKRNADGAASSSTAHHVKAKQSAHSGDAGAGARSDAQGSSTASKASADSTDADTKTAAAAAGVAGAGAAAAGAGAADADAKAKADAEAKAKAKADADAAAKAAKDDAAKAGASKDDASMDSGAETAPAEKPKIAEAVGEPDDLTRIKGIGPKLRDLCYSLGVKRFDQIAAWTPADVAEVDQHLASFKGRIERDQWVDQAKYLAAGDDAGHVAKYGA